MQRSLLAVAVGAVAALVVSGGTVAQARVPGYEVVTASRALPQNTGYMQVAALCDRGKVATGGGYEILGQPNHPGYFAYFTVMSSTRTKVNRRNGWVARVLQGSDTGEFWDDSLRIRVTAVCASR